MAEEQIERMKASEPEAKRGSTAKEVGEQASVPTAEGTPRFLSEDEIVRDYSAIAIHARLFGAQTAVLFGPAPCQPSGEVQRRA